MTKTANKGEWSELYVLLKLLGEKKLYAGDGELNRIGNLFYPILKVLRNEQDIHYEYALDGEIIIISEDGKELLRKPVADFLKKANTLLDIIHKEKGTFAIPEIEQFMSEIHCNKIKAGSKQKKDITIVIHDLRTGMTPTLGFSIKSRLVVIQLSLMQAKPLTSLLPSRGTTSQIQRLKLSIQLTRPAK